MEKNKKRTWIFEEAPIPEAVFTMAIPTIITQLINIVYNFADAWYVGRTVCSVLAAPARSPGHLDEKIRGEPVRSLLSVCLAGLRRRYCMRLWSFWPAL